MIKKTNFIAWGMALATILPVHDKATGATVDKGSRNSPANGKLLQLGALNIKGRSYGDFTSFFPHKDCDVMAFNEMPPSFAGAVLADGYKGWHSDTFQSGYGAFMKNAEFKGLAPNKIGALYRWGGICLGIISYHGWYFPYGPYQMNGIEYKGYAPTTDTGELVATNRDQPGRIKHREALFADEQWLIAQGADVVVIMGDFNEPAAADYSPALVRRKFKKQAVPWPMTTELASKGYTDAYRSLKPNAIRYPGNTWSPLPADEPYGIHDRIDFIWFKAVSGRITDIRVRQAETVGNDNMGDMPVQGWPYDHAGLLVTLEIRTLK